MSAHTPGPWIVGGETGYMNQRQIEPSIGVAYGAGAELEANARLIAAAPELLEALIDALDLIDSISPVEGNTVRKGRAAIVKATGGGE